MANVIRMGIKTHVSINYVAYLIRNATKTNLLILSAKFNKEAEQKQVFKYCIAGLIRHRPKTHIQILCVNHNKNLNKNKSPTIKAICCIPQLPAKITCIVISSHILRHRGIPTTFSLRKSTWFMSPSTSKLT